MRETVQIKLPALLGRRQVILNHQETFWSAGATRLTLCGTWTGITCQHHRPGLPAVGPDSKN